MTDKKLRILIIGAGGIGAYYGARLQTGRHRVSFVARGDHLQAMCQHGLQVEHPDFSFQQAVDALSIDQLLEQRQAGDYDLVLLTTKAGTTALLMQQLSNWLQQHPTLPVLSLQNGIDNEPLIGQSIGDARTLGGLAVRIGGHVTEPGCISAKGPAQVIFGAWPNNAMNPSIGPVLLCIEQAFNAAGIPTAVSPDIQLELWKKLLINNGVNPLSTLTGLDTQTLSNHPRLGTSVYRMMQEAAQAAHSDNIELSPQDVDAMFELICTFEPIKTSMLVDYEKGRPLELDEIAGTVIERNQRIGQQAPVTELVRGLLELKLQSDQEGLNPRSIRSQQD